MYFSHQEVGDHMFDWNYVTPCHNSFNSAQVNVCNCRARVGAGLLLLEKLLRRVRTLCVALRTACKSPVHSNCVINYAIAILLYRTVLRDRLQNFSRYNRQKHCVCNAVAIDHMVKRIKYWLCI